MSDFYFIPCPPLSDFAVELDDQSPAMALDCKYCGEKMWLSQKKKKLMMDKPELIPICWRCLTQKAMSGEFKDCEPETINI